MGKKILGIIVFGGIPGIIIGFFLSWYFYGSKDIQLTSRTTNTTGTALLTTGNLSISNKDKTEEIQQWDTETDSSFQKFLDKDHPFSDIYYVPDDLSNIESDFTVNNARKFQLRKEAAIQFADMAWHFWDHFKKKKKLNITSAFRSYDHQAHLLKSFCKNKHQCAEAGTSEHQAGLAIDIGSNGGKLDKLSFEWLKDNAHKWGFHNSYQKGIEIDHTMIEPWHWRYLGVELATLLWEKQMSFTEWYYQLENKDENNYTLN